ncbi:hypothetical protein C6P40_004438 [Pichia californica]|uniref:DUF3533 domain-containing protein n=1 Tax=Pichia californica TaxID=460514 RepID=A0A9P7BG01_9ASCO|nr:hypothetical protein C6P42_005314 [[Candida] californica]KAG0691187.1 hypothetical protein C6P40_004438 [[Candida] californica]
MSGDKRENISYTSSSSSLDPQPFNQDNASNIQVPIEINKNDAKNDDYDDNGGGSLMRTISEYNEMTVTSGEAIKLETEHEKDIEEGIKPKGPPPRYPFFSIENKNLRYSVLKQYAFIMIGLWAFILGVWSIYWGSMFRRDERLINLSILVNLEDDMSAPISQALQLSTYNNRMSISASWKFTSGLSEDEIIKTIHDQDYWAAIYVTKNNISDILIDGFQNGNDVNTTNFVHSFYETGRDPNTMEGIIEPTLYLFQSYFQHNLQSYSYPSIIKNLSTDQFLSLQNTSLLTSYPIIQYTDGTKVDPVTNGPLQVGLIYIIIITFFEVMWMTQLYGTVAKNAITRDYILFRLILSQINYLLISLAFTCLNAAFQINMNATWNGGFGVLWMVSFLTMSAVGGANQNVSLILFAILPPLMGYWLLFFVMINISATFAPIPLCPEFYRFTYAMPIKNAYELMKVILFNTSHRAVGRCFGILVAWIALNNALLPLCMAFFATVTKKKIMAAAKAELEKKGN